ncbi:hypothetical protein G6F24_017164 [Rhizopus arrhizus]|nr:hypothetical protein G6F24_017164 [Rhizopus arrhizus]
MSGASGKRAGVLTPYVLTLPARACCKPLARSVNVRSTVPPMTSVSAWGPPRYGTAVTVMAPMAASLAPNTWALPDP